ncbi:putative eukaryotic peptide chain release factor gtp-binding subunit [Phaeomoniella chlamydospora]|uniref:Elongation factor 1-alpha n=1 Tax=Phaeomoniella chlamydospora TaxID=158046 RepID=A0A0G2ENR3_PHACM|nr:putative eukaryotic peptide chain release factor gtp-binding subunit [Phaeomoniella chlamydospora]
MSNLDSWEDDPAAQEDNISRQTQNLNLNAGGQSFRPGASSFQPGASSFQPGQQQYGGYPQYGGQQGYGQNYGYPQYQQQNYPQYNQGYAGQQFNQGQYAAYNQAPGGFARQPQQQSQQARQAPVSIAKRPDADSASQAAAPSVPASTKAEPSPAPKAKVLSIGGDTGAPKAKVLSIGVPTPPKAESSAKKAESTAESKADTKPEDGSKVTAAKALEKTGEKAAASSGKTSPTPSSGKSSPTPAEKKAAAAREADAVLKEQTADVDEDTLQEMYGKEHVNVIFIGHVDAGKSTLGGSILYATGMVDERTMDKYKREAKEAGRETWYLSWALDLTKEERSKGKTVEVGRGFFETEKRRYSILDAPGHKTFVPNMIGGASQADVGVLVISARKGEYETGFEKGGQTREHAMLAKTQGVNKLIIAVNKMDDPTVQWSKERFEECTVKLSQFLKGLGYNPKTDLMIMPISAQTTLGIKDRVPKDVCPWYDGPSLLEYLDGMAKLERKVNAPFMMPVSGKYRDLGTMIEGRIEAGVIKKGMNYLMMPNREEVAITALYGEQEDEIPVASCGDQIRVRLRGIEEEDIMPGFVLCSPKRPVHYVSSFEAQIVILELKSILSAGFNCVLHIHTAIEEVTFDALLHKLEKGTGRKSKKPPAFAAKGQTVIARLAITGASGSVCVEKFEDYPQMGRFTLRDQGQTIAIGKITKLITDGQAA